MQEMKLLSSPVILSEFAFYPFHLFTRLIRVDTYIEKERERVRELKSLRLREKKRKEENRERKKRKK